jgi:mannose-6-phosphate isomerase-like protein (cupin superfamily)
VGALMAKRKPFVDIATEEKRAKSREQSRKYRANHPEFAQRDRDRSRARSRRKTLELHGLTEETFKRVLDSQNGLCAICSTPFTIVSGGRSRAGKPHIDHDHLTGEVRGLLCLQCNSMLGHARDNLSVLAAAKDYLQLRGVNRPRRGWSGTVTGKVWGATSTLINSPLLELHRIVVMPRAQCSLHMHQRKNNTFIVTAGRLFVDVHKNDYALVDTTTLNQGDVLTVKPGEYHRFRTGDIGAEALEIYFLEPLSEDIVRKDCGGVLDLGAEHGR